VREGLGNLELENQGASLAEFPSSFDVVFPFLIGEKERAGGRVKTVAPGSWVLF